ncbi:uncharacterized protein T551_01019 [Pneumocystis jirovecii RU7]|uniref:Uncharacterized protein n=1 Tax=Pneumocystis jirovecii (strain RU7) TaxID=1408657 RepID=A0A0W4ZTP1_PNEJ7|nr:uncharacterized protein T551_01019 [Pneumocystis jirovecii RU7]KTW31758.1 hypothetical protein T551_01019 [Pneumocystis jirovecii RU7]
MINVLFFNIDLFMNSSQSLSDALKELNHQRVSLILEINTLLLQKCIELQNEKNIEKDHLETPGSTMTGCIQRLQTNLAYLATIADKSCKNAETYIYKNPMIFSPPSNVYTLIEPYARLKSLFFIDKSPISSTMDFSTSSQLLKNSPNFCTTEQSKSGNLHNIKSNINTFFTEHQNECTNICSQPQIQKLPLATEQHQQQLIPQKHLTQLIQNTNTHCQHADSSFQQQDFLN